MMPTAKPLLTFVTSEDPKARRARQVFADAYDKARLTPEEAQRLNESGAFAIYLATGIRRYGKDLLTPELREIFGPKEAPKVLEPIEGTTALYLREPFVWKFGDDIVTTTVRDRELFPPTEPQAVGPMKGFRLLTDATDDIVVEALGPRYEVEPAQIAAAIRSQPGCMTGPLATDGHPNLFYCEGKVVNVKRQNDRRRAEWLATSFTPIMTDPWKKGCRVFCSV